MKFLKAALVASAIAGFSTSAMAQDSNTYFNVGVKTYEFDTYNLMGRLGYNFNENFGIEGEGSIGVIGEEEDGIDVDTKWDLGAYLVGRVEVSPQVELFARAGYTTVEVDIEGFGESVSENFDGFAVGGGLQYNYDSVNAVRLGYTYNEGDDLGADVIDLSYVRKF